MKNLLLLEDDPILGKGLKLLFELENFRVHWFKNITEAKHNVQIQSFDFAILDVGLPDGSGIDFCAWLRKFTYDFPIIILTAQTDEESVVKGLLSGANDYVKKPFSNKELIARVIINSSEKKEAAVKSVGDLKIDFENRKVYYFKEEVKFNRKEFDVLNFFVQRQDSIVTREMIIENALDNIEVSDRTVDSHISHIRSKLSKLKIRNVVIESEYGIGYRMKVIC